MTEEIKGMELERIRTSVWDEQLWKTSSLTTMKDFLSFYTLHDSYTIGIWGDEEVPLTIGFRWDTTWTRGKVPYPGPIVFLWPILLMRFPKVYHFHVNNRQGLYDDTIMDVLSESITGKDLDTVCDLSSKKEKWVVEQRKKIKEQKPQRTLFEGLDGWIEIAHGESIMLLCLDFEGVRVGIPGISKGTDAFLG